VRSSHLRKTPTERRRPALWAALLVVGAVLAGSFVTGAGAVSAAPQPRKAAVAKDSEPPFRVASFNVLGWKHTEKGGRHARMDSGEQRMTRTLRIFAHRSITVAGLQEFQPRQFERFKELTDGTWGAYPAGVLKNEHIHNSIVWNTAEWEAVPGQQYTLSIPYFHGHLIEMPYLQLRHKPTGRVVWFANFHNPADGAGRGSQKVHREAAKVLEIKLARYLSKSAPVILTGDMNERETYFCDMVRRSPMHSASGGSATKKKCTPPARSRIDWIFGSSDLAFSNYDLAETPFIKRTSDHPLVQADVTFAGTPSS
jgi:endonuclease/exonuclease/phosphatase family metal-dependent hydrolase